MSVEFEFVDTNVLLHAVDHSEPVKQVQATSLLTRLWTDGNGCLSVQVLQEFYVNAVNKVTIPLGADVAKQVVEDYGLWVVHAPVGASVLAAIDLHRRYRISFWDAMIVWSATELEARVLWSEDLNDGQRFGELQVRSPFTA